MSTWNSKLWRTAVRLEAAYNAAASCGPSNCLPEDAWLDLQLRMRRLHTAEFRRWTTAAACIRAAVVLDLERLGYRLRDLLGGLRSAERLIQPTTRTLYEELQATEHEFGGLEIEDGALSVTTAPIVLEGIRLGSFSIRLDRERLTGETPYAIVALEPNPAASCSETTHPHVSGERLCPGEGRSAINAALAEGRLFDFFTIVDRILHTYAAGSAYVELDRWHGVPCRDCDCTVHDDDACSCSSCEERLCSDCLIHCGGCSEGYCAGCIDRCSRCEEYACSGCLVRCRNCRGRVCDGCREEDLCETCRETMEEEIADEETNESTVEMSDASAEPSI